LNDIEIENTKVTDTISVKEPLLLDMITYNAEDYVRINRKENKLYLYNKAELYYGDITLRSGIIILDYKEKEVYAGRIIDTSGTLVQYPFFKQGINEINPDSIRYNFDTQKALIWNSKTDQGGMNVYSNYTKKQNDSVYFIKDAKVTTGGEVDDADYYFRVRKGKLVPGGKIVTGFTNMYIADVPTPLMLPFAYFPTTQNQSSGFIFPSIGENNNRGYAIQNGGYYFNLSDYFNLALIGDYYTNGSYGFRADTQYKRMYNYNGDLSFRYENLVSGERGLAGYSKSTVFNFRWSHSKDSKASPYSTFSASVNFGSSDYYQQSVNQLNNPNFLNNNLSSSISYSKTFPGTPRVNVSLTSAMSQNSQTKNVNLTLPTLQANMERIFPFAPKEGGKKGVIQNINFQYTTRAENRIITTEDNLFKSEMFKEARSGMVHNIPLSTNFKLLKNLSVSLGSSYQEVWTPQTVRYNNYSEETGTVVKDTIKKFDAFRTYNLNSSIGTTIYGTFNFGEDKKIQSIRHTIRPSISYNYNPSFEDQYYDKYIIDADGNTASYTRFEGGLFGAPGSSFSSSIGITVNNTFEAKVTDKDTTKIDPKKIKLLNNLNFSTNYNVAADSLNWAPVRMSTGFTALKNKLNLNLGATFDPYALDENKRRYGTFNFNTGGSLLRMTSANINMNYSISNKDFNRNKKNSESKEEEDKETASSGGRNDGLFGRAVKLDGTRANQFKETQSESKYPLYRSKIPWDFKIAWSFTYSNRKQERTISNNSLMFSSNVTLTPKWQVSASSGYDFKGKGFTYTSLGFDRDLNSWRMSFDWVPFSNRASWNFFIGIKSGLLSDIKYDKNREPDRKLN
jgi:lipopolysaccharide assembly outer membrane protein LptD (OstA)